TMFREDTAPIENDCACYTCKNYYKGYIAHLFHGKEMLGGTLASIHNIHFLVNLVKNIRQSILDGNFAEYKEKFLSGYTK
ncbi:MAG: tRNA-guanine transglycosylase, partial [bacterium]